MRLKDSLIIARKYLLNEENVFGLNTQAFVEAPFRLSLVSELRLIQLLISGEVVILVLGKHSADGGHTGKPEIHLQLVQCFFLIILNLGGKTIIQKSSLGS